MPDAIRVMLIDAAKRCRGVNKVMFVDCVFTYAPILRAPPARQSKSQAAPAATPSSPRRPLSVVLHN